MVKNKENSEDLEFWATNSEEGGWNIASTDEGSQKMNEEESDQQLKIQTGSDVVDDYFVEEETSEDERMIVNMGPQHPSTHGVLRLQVELEGEAVRRVKPVIGYLHTGMEKTGEELTYLQGPTNTTRMDYLSPFFNELVFSLTTEKLLDIEVPARAQTIRILMTELNRVSSHLVALATGGMDIGALSMMIFGFRERELILNFFVKEILKVIPEKLKDYDEMLLDNPIWQGRLQNVGILTTEECLAYGITGPSIRAAGYGWDLRKMQPYSGIEKFDFNVPVLQESDVFARWRIKVLEILESLKIVEQAMNSMPKGPYKIQDKKVTPPPRKRLDESMEALIHHFKIYTEGFKVPEGEAYVAVESPRGELGCYIVSDGSSKPYRMHVRGPSFCNLQALPVVMADSPIADAVAAIASLDPVIGDVDR